MNGPGQRLSPEQEERLARYRAGAMSEAERAAFEREVLASDALSGELYAEGSLDSVRASDPARAGDAAGVPARAGPAEAPDARGRAGAAAGGVAGATPRPGARVTPLRPHARAAWPLALAAAMVAVAAGVMVATRRPGPEAPVPGAPGVMRGEHGEARLLRPGDGEAADSARFVWTRVPRADVYRIEVYDDEGRLVSAGIARDTLVEAFHLLPDTVRAGLWRVVPVAADGTELTASGPEPFRLAAR
jgi:hypothetical protein